MDDDDLSSMSVMDLFELSYCCFLGGDFLLDVFGLFVFYIVFIVIFQDDLCFVVDFVFDEGVKFICVRRVLLCV